MTSGVPEEEETTGGELDHTSQAIPLDKLVASNITDEEEED